MVPGKEGLIQLNTISIRPSPGSWQAADKDAHLVHLCRSNFITSHRYGCWRYIVIMTGRVMSGPNIEARSVNMVTIWPPSNEEDEKKTGSIKEN